MDFRFPIFLIAIVLTPFSATAANSQLNCDRKFFNDSFVCVCTAKFCDTVIPLSPTPPDTFQIYLSTRSFNRLNYTNLMFTKTPLGQLYSINVSQTYQEIIGFGGAFTDAAGINIRSLSTAAQGNFMNSYFSPTGIEYTVGRVPMASCDFSTRSYSYDDFPHDITLANFSLTNEDFQLKIPYIQWAQEISKKQIKLFGSPWSAPGWMKTTGEMKGPGTLLTEYNGAWAHYFVRFLQEYEKQNVSFWGLTAQNEPSSGYIPNYKWQTMGFLPWTQKDFIRDYLGPALVSSGYKDVNLMILDDQRFLLPYWTELVYADSKASQYIAGTAVHWYGDKESSPSALTKTHNQHPDKFILATEACAGYIDNTVVLGSWSRAEDYINDIFDDLENWVTGWVDWNIALDTRGGPNWVNNVVDSPVIVDSAGDQFFKQPMFYAMGHFSKFLDSGTKRVDISTKVSDPRLRVLAFVKNGQKTVIVFNRSDNDITTSIYDPQNGYANFVAPARAIQTVVWWSS